MTSASKDISRQNRLVLAAGFVGNILEWYDFAVYGFFAATIGNLFFPSVEPTTSLIASFGAFAAGFLMRPVGAVLFGHVGDLLGRKKALTLSVIMMAVPTFLIGLLPTHEQIGLAAPALYGAASYDSGSVGWWGIYELLRFLGRARTRESARLLRFLESHRSHRRDPTGVRRWRPSHQYDNSGTARAAQLAIWGWRIPFIAAVIVGLIGLIIRRTIPDQQVTGERTGSPLVEAVTGSWKGLLQAVGLNMMDAVAFYTVFIYMATWLVLQVGETHAEALKINTLSMVVLAVVVPFIALWSDRIGRKPFLLIGSAGMAVFTYLLVWMMSHHDFAMILSGQIGFAILLGTFSGVIPATMAELFPRRVRVTATSLSYNLPYAVFGGTAPMVAAWLVTKTHNAMAISWYVAGMAALTFLVALNLHESRVVRLDI